MMHEFELIQQFFNRQISPRSDVTLGIGDDAAIVTVPREQQLAITTDTLVAGVHFAHDAKPFDIGYKSLAVNLSDLAAMGASPAWITLALTLPEANETWLRDFSHGLFTLADRYRVQLIGGDITRGPLSITIQALGLLPQGKALTRSGAKANDLIYVTHTLGDAGLALRNRDPSSAHLHRPEPRLAVGEALRDIAHACIDISDGLAADLGHILAQSHVGAIVNVDHLPLSDSLRKLEPNDAIGLALNAGDDYELCFTIAAEHQAALEQAMQICQSPITCIGRVTQQPGLILQFHDGKPYQGTAHGYQHF